MPPTTDNIPEKPGFDVYAMLLILSCVFLLIGSFMLYEELVSNWGFMSSNNPQVAEHITQINDDPVKYPYTVKVRKQDMEDWKRAASSLTGKNVEFPVTKFEWPEGYDPLAFPIRPGGADNLKAEDESKQAEHQQNIDALMKNYVSPDEAAPPAPAPAPTN